MFGYPHTVTVVRASFATDANGTPVAQRLWENATRTTVRNVSVQPGRTSQRPQNDQYRVETTWDLISAPRTNPDIRNGDRIEWDGRSLLVVGEPRRWPGLAGGVDHVEAVLQDAPPEPGEGGDTAAGQLASGVRTAAARGARWTP